MFILSVLAVELNGCQSFDLIDDTGTGTNGWGGPDNPLISDVLTDSVDILPFGFVLPVTINVYPGLLAGPYNITNGALSILGNLSDGIWQITRTVTGVYSSGVNIGQPFSFAVTKSFLFTCNTECCVSKAGFNAANPIANSKCNFCNTADIEARFIDLQAKLDIANYAAECGQYDTANQLISQLNNLCKKGC